MSDLRSTRAPLSAQLAELLVHRIAHDRYGEGEMIPTEAELAAEVGVGRSTVREAMLSLVGAGMVEIRRGRGTVVRSRADWSPFDPLVLQARAGMPGGARETTRKVLEARQLVEVGVAELAAARATHDHVVTLFELTDAMAAAASVADFTHADLAFHETLLEAADNSFVAALFAPIEALISDERRRTSEPEDLRPAAVAAHRRIADAVQRREPAAARAAMAAHLGETRQKMELAWSRTE